MKKDIQFGIILMLAGLFVYHFVAANSAEQDIKQAIAEANREAGLFYSLNIAELTIHPFAGNVYLKGIKALNRDHMFEAASFKMDLSYLDFLRIYFNGVKEGFGKIENAELLFASPLYTWRSNFFEFGLEELSVHVQGPFSSTEERKPGKGLLHPILDGTNLKITHKTTSMYGALRAKRLRVNQSRLPTDSNPGIGIDSAVITGITWTPPVTMQNRYEMFFRGFGYRPDSIPAERLSLTAQLPGNNRLTLDDLAIKTELFRAGAEGTIRFHPELIGLSSLDGVNVRFDNFSDRFKQFLDNAEKLFGVRFADENNRIRFSLNGILADPELVRQPG